MSAGRREFIHFALGVGGGKYIKAIFIQTFENIPAEKMLD
jgi:hypothetical protein